MMKIITMNNDGTTTYLFWSSALDFRSSSFFLLDSSSLSLFLKSSMCFFSSISSRDGLEGATLMKVDTLAMFLIRLASFGVPEVMMALVRLPSVGVQTFCNGM